MKAALASSHQLVHEFGVGNRALDQFGGAARDKMLDIDPSPRAQVVENHDVVAPAHERLGDVRSDKPGPTSDQVLDAGSLGLPTSP